MDIRKRLTHCISLKWHTTIKITTTVVCTQMSDAKSKSKMKKRHKQRGNDLLTTPENEWNLGEWFTSSSIAVIFSFAGGPGISLSRLGSEIKEALGSDLFQELLQFRFENVPDRLRRFFDDGGDTSLGGFECEITA